MDTTHRTEQDSMGTVSVPAEAWWGAQTQRALAVGAISGRPMPRPLLHALARVKRACAHANGELGLLSPDRATAIAEAARQVISGQHDDQFPVDCYQTGSGTASNMNMNEVLGNLASVALGGERGTRSPVHPNDHVNLGQSSNDAVPTALHLAAALEIDHRLVPALRALHAALLDKDLAWQPVLKAGRTHLMDATPIRLGQEVGGWAAQVEHGLRRASQAREALMELALGGTAVGTGLNRHERLPALAIERLRQETGLPLREAADHFEAQGARDGVVEAHGLLETIATSLFKIAQDLRLLASGPRTGLAELRLPALAPGSSIMPGKVNPVMCEVLTQACARVIGNGATVRVAGMGGQLQLNVFVPVLAEALLDSIGILAQSSAAFTDQAVLGMEVNRERCEDHLEQSLMSATALVPALGYDRTAALAKQALASGRTLRELARDLLPAEELDRLLDYAAMTRPSGD